MMHGNRIVDRQVGRNAELFARVVAGFETKERRRPYLRILVSIVEQAHPEWSQTAQKARQVGFLVSRLSDHGILSEEVEEIVHLRDRDRGA